MGTVLLVIFGIISTVLVWTILISSSDAPGDKTSHDITPIVIIAVIGFLILGISQCS